MATPRVRKLRGGILELKEMENELGRKKKKKQKRLDVAD